jgi:hypothetical protein
MKPFYRFVLAALVVAAFAQPVVAAGTVYEFQLDDAEAVDAPVEPPATEDEADPSAADAAPAAAAELAPVPVEKVAEPASVPAATAPVAPKAPAKPAAPAKAAEPKEIPLIETKNDVTSHADVTYVTGGIGADEQEAIQAAKADYNLHIMSASINGAFVGDARVVIVRTKGADKEVMLNVVSGPLLYVRLPEGSYSLEATLGEQVKRQNFTVSKKGAAVNIHLGWKVDAVVAK